MQSMPCVVLSGAVFAAGNSVAQQVLSCRTEDLFFCLLFSLFVHFTIVALTTPLPTRRKPRSWRLLGFLNSRWNAAERTD